MRVDRRRARCCGHSAVFNKSATCVVVNKMRIDDGNYALGGAVVQPNSLIQMTGWSHEHKEKGQHLSLRRWRMATGAVTSRTQIGTRERSQAGYGAVMVRPMSKRNRPTNAVQAAHRRDRHEYRSAYNSPEAKAARAAAGGAGAKAPVAKAAKAAATAKTT